MLWTLPNALTVARVAAAPLVLAALVAWPGPTGAWLALVLFVLASVTDFFDGWLARRWGQESAFGRMLDPIADKAMVALGLLGLAAERGADPLFAAPAAVILLRETLVAGLREYLKGAPVLAVTRLAKWKTTVQMVAIAALIGAGAMPWAGAPGLGLLWLAAGLTAVTGWDYMQKGIRHLREAEGG